MEDTEDTATCPRPECTSAAPLSRQRGIEVGHIFYLGTKYSQGMILHPREMGV